MKFLVCVLFSGILGFGHSHDNTPGPTGMETTPELRVKVSEMVKKSCLDNGGQQALDSFVNGTREAKACLTSTFTEVAKEGKRNAQSQKLFESVLNLYCIKVPTLKGCAKNFMNSMRACKELESHEHFDTAYRVLARILDFVCDEKEKIAEAVTALANDRCITRQYKAAIGCMLHLIPALRTTDFMAGIESIGQLRSDTDEERCRNIEIVQRCAVNELSVCENQIVAEVMDSLFKSINVELPCENLEKSYALPRSVVNVALLIATVAIYL